MADPRTYSVEFEGATLYRGFWLYAWEVTSPGGEKMIYVGRTGDSSSPNAQSPFNRMGQHLGNSKHSSALRRHLQKRSLSPEECTFRLVAHGPILHEVPGKNLVKHKKRRDKIAAMEKQLAKDFEAAGYDILNTVASKLPLDEKAYRSVNHAFAKEFNNL